MTLRQIGQFDEYHCVGRLQNVLSNISISAQIFNSHYASSFQAHITQSQDYEISNSSWLLGIFRKKDWKIET